MKRASRYIAFLLLNALLFSTLILSRPGAAAACPDEPPKTLLQLYKSSETIYIARFARTEKGEPKKSDENYTVTPIKKHFDVSMTLKGVSKKMFVLDEEEFDYTPETTDQAAADEPAQGEPAVDEHEPEEGDEYDEEKPLQEGDTVILFLTRDQEDPKRTVLADYRGGAKRVEPSDLKTYERRIRELNAIFGSKKPDDSKVVDWLVRLAEDPVTRWDGAFELTQAFENLEFNEKQSEYVEETFGGKEDEETGGDGKIIEAETEEAEAIDDVYDNSVYATLLTDSHKQRLSNLVVTGEGPMVSGDLELIELVKRWGDANVGRSLIDKIRLGGYPAYETSRMMATAAQIFKDKKLEELSTEYDEVAWGEEDAEIEPPAKPEVEEAKSPETPSEPEGENTEKKAEVKRPTYGEQRSAVTARFLARADAVMAKKRSAATAKK